MKKLNLDKNDEIKESGTLEVSKTKIPDKTPDQSQTTGSGGVKNSMEKDISMVAKLQITDAISKEDINANN